MTPGLIIFVFLAGVATIVSPCVLPVLPIVLSTATGAGRLRPIGVVLGLALSFTFVTLVAGAAVQALAVPAAWLRVPDNVRAATKEQGVTWPVALDPDFKTWSAYNNRYWPAFYFIDANGHLRYTHFGEGNYEYHDKVVQQLLSEANVASR